MMTELQKKIVELKEEKNAVILVHNYQRSEIQKIADYLGDSLGLAKEAAKTNADIIVFCGVMFMAETAKILSPDKTVLIPEQDAGCPMADMITAEDVIKLKKQHPEAKVVSYVNTNADVKAVTDVCCTSSNAVEVVKNIDSKKIIFTPDKNLASWVQRFVNKEIIVWNGFCYVHDRISVEEVIQAKKEMPDALVLIHPECDKKVADLADRVGSTSDMIRFAKESDKKQFIIGTELGLIERLQRENPSKEFYSAGTVKICQNMKKITLESVYNSLYYGNYKINLPEKTMKFARKSLNEMLKYD